MSMKAGSRAQYTYHGHTPRTDNAPRALSALRPAVLAAARLLLLPIASAAPLHLWGRGAPAEHVWEGEDGAHRMPETDKARLVVYLSVAIALVLLGGIFAGLTIALMGQDETYLQVIATSGEGSERKHAAKVLKLLNRGKHWVLVTLLLSNVITNETLPIVLDRSLGGGWPAVVASTVLIVIFGEIAPQSVCVRFGLSIGAFMAPFVLTLMWIMCPIAWPTAKFLDFVLGEDHGTMYKKAGLKTLVTLHKTLGGGAGEQLMEDEVTIINSVLDLKDKPVGDIMTPMADVFTMNADTVLDERMMDTILSQGYSRIPIYAPDNPRNFIGMLLVKILITYDPEDCKRVRDFALATLPETAPHTSCLDIINFFQEGKSHMVLVSDFPGQDKGATGVVTLEDVIEELIGEEIIDESDVFVDVHKAIRRMAPAPKTRFRGPLLHARHSEDLEDDDGKEADERQPLLGNDADSHNRNRTNGQTTFMMRRKSSAASDSTCDRPKPVPVRSSATDMREHLKHLGPSNAASKPKATKYTSVKIKPGVGTIPENKPTTTGTDPDDDTGSHDVPPSAIDHPAVEEAVENLRSGRPRGASDGAAALYGTMNTPELRPVSLSEVSRMTAQEASKLASENTLALAEDNIPPSSVGEEIVQKQNKQGNGSGKADGLELGSSQLSQQSSVGRQPEDDDRISDLVVSVGPDRSKKRLQARSGSITETTMEVGGMRKTVLETTSSSEEGSQDGTPSPRQGSAAGTIDANIDTKDFEKDDGPQNGDHKKKRKKRGKKKKGSGSGD